MVAAVRQTRSAVIALVAVVVCVGLAPDQDAAEQAAREIAAARDRANQAAEEFFAAESRLELLALEQGRLEVDIEQLEGIVAELEAAVEQVAVGRFVGSGASGIPILTDLRGPTEQLHGAVLTQVVAESGTTTLDDYDEARTALRDKRVELEENQRALERQRDELTDLQAEAEAEVERLREVESRRLEDEAVQIALAAQQREEARQLAELERRQAEAARSAESSSGETTGNQGASGGSAGGRTGGGGAGTNPRAAGTGYVDTIVCPVQGASGYGDTWGAPRSGGRRHQGTDMLAPTGTPLQAVIGGTVSHDDNVLGGVTISLVGDNGNRYYYAHLSAYEGPPGRVEQGQVIGYIGDTGNATGTPHLHFEIRPGGGVPVNPYASVRAAGC